MAINQVWRRELDGNGQEVMTLIHSEQEPPRPSSGDSRISAFMCAQGTEALIATVSKHINTLRKKHGLTGITYKQFVTEVETEMSAIIKDSEDKEE